LTKTAPFIERDPEILRLLRDYASESLYVLQLF
jgi:hypothetical protein